MNMQMPLAGENDPDRALIEAIAAGQSHCLEQFVRRNERWLRGVVFAAIGDAGQVDDVLQQAWLRVWQNAWRLEDASRWRPWLFRLARNAAIDTARRARRRLKLWQRLREAVSGDDAEPARPEHRLMASEEHRRVLEEIGRLPERYRQPFVLRQLEGWSYRQIAETLAIPVATVETRLARARRILRERLSRGESR
jgi:RNA polymerase sigma-70 factor (ECF subfamily)